VFTLPVSAWAGSDRMVVAQAGGGGADGPDAANRQPGTMSSSNFDRLDRNGDGYISRDE
jgi:hypothetical protein